MLAMQGLAAQVRGRERSGVPTLVLMHFLGGSAREWDEVIANFDGEFRTIAVDLPGFGDSSEVSGYSVAEMAGAVKDVIREFDLKDYVLVGHSMSGKVAAVLARCAEDQAARGLRQGLRGLILIAPSPPGPEPMTDEKRNGMIASLGEDRGNAAEERVRARAYVTKNEERDLAESVMNRAVDEVLRMNRTAWVAWLTHGSKEDWGERVGLLTLPTLVVAGEKDLSLGPDTQQRVTMPHLARGELKTVKGCSHLVPMERPVELAEMMREFVGRVSA